MSRIGRKPINIPAGVDVKIDGNVITVKGPKGTLTQKFHPNMTVAMEGNVINVSRPDDDKGRSKRADGVKMTKKEREDAIAKLEKEMQRASKLLEIEYAAVLRDRIIKLRNEK